MKNKSGANISTGKNFLDVPHQGKNLRFVAPAFGVGTYTHVGTTITNAGLCQPTMAENASLVLSAWEKPAEKYLAEIISKMRNHSLWSFNGLLYVPEDKGVYINDNPEIAENTIVMDRDDLVKRLESKDKSVRFVAFDKIQIGEQASYSALAKNAFIVGLTGEEEAEKLAQVASKHRRKPHVWALTQTDTLLKRVASLNSAYLLGGYRLDVGGDDGFHLNNGIAFAVYSN